MKTINIFSDFACPWCYIGEKRLNDAIEKLGLAGEINIFYRAFELDPNAPKEGDKDTVERIAAKYRLPIEEARKRVQMIDKAGQDAGIDFHFETCKSANTFDAHRLMKLAEMNYDTIVVNKLNKALFDAYFTKNLVISDPKVLTEIAIASGIESEDVENLLNSDQYKEEVINDENIAHNLQITSVPFFIIDNKVGIPGAISTEDFIDVLQKLDSEIKAEEKGDTCGCDETGCRI